MQDLYYPQHGTPTSSLEMVAQVEGGRLSGLGGFRVSGLCRAYNVYYYLYFFLGGVRGRDSFCPTNSQGLGCRVWDLGLWLKRL